MQERRQIVLDTETTGLDVSQGHRIIEIAALELINRQVTGNDFHRKCNPRREIDEEASKIHGYTLQALAEEPDFKDFAQELWDFLGDSELIIHNAQFDLRFLDAEFRRLGFDPLASRCQVEDTLELARKSLPGARHSLDALCRRYGIDNSKRTLHSALLDAKLLAEVYLRMTGGEQVGLLGDDQPAANDVIHAEQKLETAKLEPPRKASPEELQLWQEMLAALEKRTGREFLWRKLAMPAEEGVTRPQETSDKQAD